MYRPRNRFYIQIFKITVFKYILRVLVFTFGENEKCNASLRALSDSIRVRYVAGNPVRVRKIRNDDPDTASSVRLFPSRAAFERGSTARSFRNNASDVFADLSPPTPSFKHRFPPIFINISASAGTSVYSSVYVGIPAPRTVLSSAAVFRPLLRTTVAAI